jgi:membrane protease YdiL (CAAX protease family)
MAWAVPKTRPPLMADTDPADQPRWRRWIAAHPARAFLLVVFSIGYPLLALLILVWQETLPGRTLLDQLPIGPDQIAALLITGTALLPAALTITWAVDGTAGITQLIRRAVRWRIRVRWWLLILGGVPAGTIGLAICAGNTVTAVDVPLLLYQQTGALLVNLAAVTLWEELAWAGVLQTRLEQRHRGVVAALMTAVPFALLHWPLVLLTGRTTAGSAATALAFFLILSVVLRMLLGVISRATRSSILAVAAQHAMFNRTTNADGVAANLVSGNAYQVTVVITALVTAIIMAPILRHRRSARPHLSGALS